MTVEFGARGCLVKERDVELAGNSTIGVWLMRLHKIVAGGWPWEWNAEREQKESVARCRSRKMSEESRGIEQCKTSSL
jgi:hypothetical protein